MKSWLSIPCLAAMTVAAVSVSVAADPPTAVRLTLPEPAFYGATAETDGEGFRVALKRDMATPGFKLEVDGVQIDGKTSRIVVRVTERPPAGMAAQVITPTAVTIPLGRLTRGSYILEIQMRRGNSGEYGPAHALVLSAF
jgi:hypothetical protein